MNNKKSHAMHCLLFAMGALVSTVIWPGPGHTAEDNGKTGNVTRGARQWAENCSRCHNMREPSEFRDDLWKPIVGHMRIRAGLTGRQARDILAFLQASNYKTAATPNAAASGSQLSGKEIYGQTCMACHGADGRGALSGMPDLTKPDGPLSKPAELLFQHIIEGFQSPGSPMAMPPKGGNPELTEDEIRAVLSYILDEFGP